MKTIEFYTKPVSVNQRYGIYKGRNILTKKYRDTKKALQQEAQHGWSVQPIDTEDISLNILVYYKGRRMDVDAYIKILLDSMEGVVYTNDALVSEIHVFRMKAKENKVIVQVL